MSAGRSGLYVVSVRRPPLPITIVRRIANGPKWLSKIVRSRHVDNFPRVQDVQRVPRQLERAHEFDGGISEFLEEQRYLVHAYTVLAGTCSIHCESASHDPLIEALGFVHLSRIVWVNEDHAAEVAVPDVSEDGTWQG